MDLEAQIGEFSQASTDIDGTASPPVAQPRIISSHLILAIEDINGNCILVVVPVQQAATGEQVWTRIRNEVQQELSPHRLWGWIQKFFIKKVAGTATVRQIVPCETTSSYPRFRISLHEYMYDTLFTQLFENPSLISGPQDYLSCNEPFAVRGFTTYDLSGQNIIVVSAVLNKVKLAGVLVIPFVITLCFVGLLLQRTVWGIAVGVSTAVVSFCLGLIIWMQT